MDSNLEKDKEKNVSGSNAKSGPGKPGRVEGKNSLHKSGGVFLYKKLRYEINTVLQAAEFLLRGP